MGSYWIFIALLLVLLVLVYRILVSEGATQRFVHRRVSKSANEMMGQHPAVGKFISSKEPRGFIVVRDDGQWLISEGDLDQLFGYYKVDVVDDTIVGVQFGVPAIVCTGSMHKKVWKDLPKST